MTYHLHLISRYSDILYLICIFIASHLYTKCNKKLMKWAKMNIVNIICILIASHLYLIWILFKYLSISFADVLNIMDISLLTTIYSLFHSHLHIICILLALVHILCIWFADYLLIIFIRIAFNVQLMHIPLHILWFAYYLHILCIWFTDALYWRGSDSSFAFQTSHLADHGAHQITGPMYIGQPYRDHGTPVSIW